MKILTTNSTLHYFWRQTINKYLGVEERFLWWVETLKPRSARLLKHLYRGITGIGSHYQDANIGWWSQLGLYIVEFFAVAELYESSSSLVKYNTRPLTDHELEIGLSVFGEAINFDLVRIDDKARIAAKKGNFAYVSFHTINSWGAINDAHFIHELVHVWQYEQMGAIYIPRCLAAQRTALGYNYGGVAALKTNEHIGLNAFNLEQQADIVADYFRLKNQQRPTWGNATEADIPLYERYVNEIRITA